jgi:hypothetical protein
VNVIHWLLIKDTSSGVVPLKLSDLPQNLLLTVYSSNSMSRQPNVDLLLVCLRGPSAFALDSEDIYFQEVNAWIANVARQHSG